jgi:type IV pilus assembly protein PilM
MLNLNRTNIQPIGLDIGHDSVKLLQLEVLGSSASPAARSLSVVAAAKQAMPEEARKNPANRAALAADVIRQLLAQQPFVGREVVAAIPRELVHVKNLRLPPIPLDEMEAAVQFEAKSLFPFDTDEACIQFLPAGEVRHGNDVRQEVIVLAVKRAETDQYLQQLDRSGVVVRSLDTEITGLFRAFERYIRRREDESEVQMFIDIGARRTQVILGKGREINFYKPIEIGGLHLLDAVSRKLSITIDEARALRQRLLDGEEAAEINPRKDPVRQAVFDATRSVAEDLGRELAMCLRYYTVTFRGHRAARARIVGGEAADPQLHAILKAILNVPVEAGRPLFSADTSRMRTIDRRGPMSQWALATGLGLRYVPGYFAAKDGRPRTAAAAAPAAAAERADGQRPAFNVQPPTSKEESGEPALKVDRRKSNVESSARNDSQEALPGLEALTNTIAPFGELEVAGA